MLRPTTPFQSTRRSSNTWRRCCVPAITLWLRLQLVVYLIANRLLQPRSNAHGIALDPWSHEPRVKQAAIYCSGHMCYIMQMSKDDLVQSLRRQSKGYHQNSSQYRGVTKHQKGKWEARIGQVVGKKYKYLGLFTSEIDAAVAYDRAAVAAKRIQAQTNFDLSHYTDLLSALQTFYVLPVHGTPWWKHCGIETLWCRRVLLRAHPPSPHGALGTRSAFHVGHR